jgi:hypothetical protein
MIAEVARPWFSRQAQWGTRVIALDAHGRGFWPEPVPTGTVGRLSMSGPPYVGAIQWRIEFADEEAARAFDLERGVQYAWWPASDWCPLGATWEEAETWLLEVP